MARAQVQRDADVQFASLKNGKRSSVARRAARMGVHQRVGHLGELHAWSAVTQALHIRASAFEEKEELIGQTVRFEKSGISAKLHQTSAVLVLALFGDDARRMVFFRKLDGGIRHRATA